MSPNADWDNLIRDAIISLERRYTSDRPVVPEPGVPLAELRPLLDAHDTSRTVQDGHLERLSQQRELHLAPESNRKALRKLDNAAAIRIGHEDFHWVCWLGKR